MKHIIAATDFSPASDNACVYAAQFAKAFGAKLSLFHCFTVPVVFGETPIVPVSFEEMEALALKKLFDTATTIEQKTGMKADCKASGGDVCSELQEFVEKGSGDVVIMGMKSYGNMSQMWIGSTVTAAIGKSKFPVLVIPEKISFKDPQRILFASDYQDTPSLSVLDLIREIAKRFKSDLMIANIMPSGTNVDMARSIERMKLEMNFEDLPHTFHFPQATNISEGLVLFVNEKGADLIVVMHHSHGFLYKLFHKSESKALAFHTPVPLLNIPGA